MEELQEFLDWSQSLNRTPYLNPKKAYEKFGGEAFVFKKYVVRETAWGDKNVYVYDKGICVCLGSMWVALANKVDETPKLKELSDAGKLVFTLSENERGRVDVRFDIIG